MSREGEVMATLLGLRFVEREVEIKHEHHDTVEMRKVRILQQYLDDGTWSDIPLFDEETGKYVD